jgi:AcrR family transcriptional regulator
VPKRIRTNPRRAPRQRRAEDTVDVLLEATERVVAKKGFHDTTTNHIAEAAGVSIGTLYHYFPGKEALVEAVVHRMWGRELMVLEERRARLLTAPLDVAVHEIVAALVAVMAERRELYRRWYSEASHLGQLGRGLEMSEMAILALEDVLQTRKDEIRPTNLRFAADLVVKTALAIVRTGARDYEKETKTGELAKELGDMLARYLMK